MDTNKLTTNRTKSLYDRDILLWVEDTVTKLRNRNFEDLDIENLIEEVESLGRSERRELLSRLTTLLEHLLKRLYVELPENYRSWEITIRNQRIDIKQLLKETPSLKSIWQESFRNALEIALEKVMSEYEYVKFPDQWQYSTDLEIILSQKFWEQ
jgi:hypothetical protein